MRGPDMTQPIPTVVLDSNVLIALSHSGGKDSQLSLIETLKHVPADRVLVVHATFPEEWPGALELARDQAAAAGVAFEVAHAIYKDGREKTFLNRVEDQMVKRPDAPPFPSIKNRWCTSELKTGPIEKVIRSYMKEHGFTKVVSAEGIRAAESTARRKRQPFVERTNPNDGLLGAGRQAWTWYPIFDMPTADVIPAIRAAGQEPNWAYIQGNERLSCQFCFLASENDLRNGARHNPELFRQYVELEQRTGSTLSMHGRSLVDIVGDAAALVDEADYYDEPETDDGQGPRYGYDMTGGE